MMFHAHIISFVTCFICILLHLFTFSWTNLLTRLSQQCGTWGSPDAAKVGPTFGPTKKTSKTWTRDRRWATPSPPEDGQDTPGPREGSRWPLGPTSPRGIAPDKVAYWFRGPTGGRTTPGGFVRIEEDKNASVSARRQKTWAPRRRTGSWSWSVGVSAHYLHLS